MPLKVLDQQTTYLLAITRQLTDASGIPVTPVSTYVKAKAEQTTIGEHIRAVESKLTERQGIAADDIVYAAHSLPPSLLGLVWWKWQARLNRSCLSLIRQQQKSHK